MAVPRRSSASPLPGWCRYDTVTGTLDVDLHIQPGSSRTEPCGTHGDRLKIRVGARPVEGEANRALVAWLAEALDVPTRNVRILRGDTSRAKTLRATGVSAAACEALAAA